MRWIGHVVGMENGAPAPSIRDAWVDNGNMCANAFSGGTTFSTWDVQLAWPQKG